MQKVEVELPEGLTKESLVTVHPQFCPLPRYMGDTRCKMMIIDADTVEKAEKANACAVENGWINYMGGVCTDDVTGRPGLVMFKPQ